MKEILEQFVKWIKDVEEDTPIPYEIKNICFGGEGKALYFFGTELENFNNYEFFPLEAQYFFVPAMDDKNINYLLESLIIYALKDVEIKRIYKGKRVFIKDGANIRLIWGRK